MLAPLRPFLQAADPHRRADVLPRLLRRPPHVGRDRLHAVPRRPGGRPPLPATLPEPPLEPLPAPPRDRYDTIVVGSGAAGSILAYRFAEAGRRVLVLERGPHVDPRGFTDDEVGQYLRLYNEGALQLATDFSLQVLQGMCVGGGTTINNALCLARPRRCSTTGRSAGSTAARCGRRSARSGRWLGVTPIRDDDHHRRPRALRRRRSARWACPAARADGGQHHRRLPRHRLLQHRLRVRRQAGGARLRAPARAAAASRSRCSPTSEVERIVRDGDRATGVIGRHARAASGSRSRPTSRRRGRGRSARAALLQRSGLGGDARRRAACTSTSTRRSPPTSRTRSTRSPGSRCRTPTSRRGDPPPTWSRRGSTRRPRRRSRCPAGSTATSRT